MWNCTKKHISKSQKYFSSKNHSSLHRAVAAFLSHLNLRNTQTERTELKIRISSIQGKLVCWSGYLQVTVKQINYTSVNSTHASGDLQPETESYLCQNLLVCARGSKSI